MANITFPISARLSLSDNISSFNYGSHGLLLNSQRLLEPISVDVPEQISLDAHILKAQVRRYFLRRLKLHLLLSVDVAKAKPVQALWSKVIPSILSVFIKARK